MKKQVEPKVIALERSVTAIMKKHILDFVAKERKMYEKLAENKEKSDQVEACFQIIDRNKREFENSVFEMQKSIKELGLNFDGRVKEMLDNFLRGMAENLRAETQALVGKVAAMERVLCNQEIPWEKMVELVNKTEETIQLQVKREMALQNRKMIEVMMGQMMDEKIKQSQKEIRMDQLKLDIENANRQQLSIVLKKIHDDFQVEKKERISLQAELKLLREELCATKAKISVSAAQPISIPVQVSKSSDDKGVSSDAPKKEKAQGFEIEGVEVSPPTSGGIFFVEGDFGGMMGGDPGLRVAQVSVCPIGASPAQPTLINLSNPVSQQVLRNLIPPKFSGRFQEWPDFVREWERYLRKLSMGQEINNVLKLELLEGCLDDVNQKFLRIKQSEVGEKLTFNEIFAKLQDKYSKDQSFGARKRWEEICLMNPGKITSRDWEDFEANFLTAWHGVKDTTEEEARRMLLQKLPGFITRWITEEEERKILSKPTVKMNVPGDTHEVGVAESVLKLTGKKPTKVSKINEGEYEIIFQDIADCEKLKAFNGKCFKNSQILVKVTQIEPVLTVHEIFLLINHKLTLRDRQDYLQTSSQHTRFFGNRRARSLSVQRTEKQPKEKVESSVMPKMQEKTTHTPQNNHSQILRRKVTKEKGTATNQTTQNQGSQNVMNQPAQNNGQFFSGVPNPRGGFWVPVEQFQQWNSPPRWNAWGNQSTNGKGFNSQWQNANDKNVNSPWQNSVGKGSNPPWQGTGGRGQPDQVKGGKGKGKGQTDGKGKGKGKGRGSH